MVISCVPDRVTARLALSYAVLGLTEYRARCTQFIRGTRRQTKQDGIAILVEQTSVVGVQEISDEVLLGVGLRSVSPEECFD